QFDARCIHYLPGEQRPRIDLKLANLLQLESIGVPSENIEISAFSTVLNNDLYFSYRKEQGQTGRMLAVVGVKS
ncbi:MAG TPA: laccase domain-containing protein, partial [Chitinophagales bacterium]|nr:laccase domain-containing protein [Chitinophagales bacterium]